MAEYGLAAIVAVVLLFVIIVPSINETSNTFNNMAEMLQQYD
jgi:hypothetical protein